jgi:hypothetical protein
LSCHRRVLSCEMALQPRKTEAHLAVATVQRSRPETQP